MITDWIVKIIMGRVCLKIVYLARGRKASQQGTRVPLRNLQLITTDFSLFLPFFTIITSK
jgi:hypothetical protein